METAQLGEKIRCSAEGDLFRVSPYKMKKLPPSTARKEIFSEKSGQLVQLQSHAALLPGSVVLVQETLVDSLIDGLDGLAASVTILNAVFWEEIMDAMLELFACIENDEKKQTSAELLVQKALSIIKECYSDGINLEETARRLHVTEQYLGTQLKKETGSSFTEIIRRYKIAHVKQLLLDTELKLNQIASMAGFSDPKYMSKVFKQEVGMLPNEYRRMNT